MSAEKPVEAPDEHTLEVQKTARYWTLGSGPEVWFVLHGYGQLARRFLRRFAALDDGRRTVVAPEALSRFYAGSESGRHGPSSIVGATWMTRECREDEIRDYVAYLDRLADRVCAKRSLQAPTDMTVFGFSQGVATASRWIAYGSFKTNRLILWGDTLPPDLDMERAAQALSGVEVVLVRGDEDSAVSPARAAEEARLLREAGIGFRVVTYPGGHDIDENALLSLR